jgi:pyruvate kinase
MWRRSSPLIRRALSRCTDRDSLIVAPLSTVANNITAISADKLFKSRLNALPPTGCMTKLVCTIGPATDSVEKINELVTHGMNVARLNFSHAGSDYSYPEQCLARIRAAPGKHFQCATGGATNERAPLLPNNVRAILVDTKGPEIRTGPLQGGVDVANIDVGDRVDLTTRTVSSDPAPGPEDHHHIIQVDYQSIAKSLTPGKQALLDDGLIALEVVEADPSTGTVICVALNGGPIKKNKGVNLPDTVLDLPALTEKDKRDLKWACDVGADFVAASFIRTASNVRAVIAYLDRCLAEMPRKSSDDKAPIRPMVISKIESKEGVDNFDEILAASDGVSPKKTTSFFKNRKLRMGSDTFISAGLFYRLWLLEETLEWKFLTAKCLRLRK